MIQQPAKILWNEKVGATVYKIGLTCSEHYAAAKPGQFVMLRLAARTYPLLRRPFSIHNLIVEDGALRGLELLYKVVGTATAALAQHRVGDMVDIFGPLGTGFIIPSKAKSVYVVAGGIGVAPMVFLATQFCQKNSDFSTWRAFIGGRTKEELLCCDDFARFGVEVITTTDDGSAGDQCLVTHPLETVMNHTVPDLIVACGPMAMLACVVGIAEKHHVPCQVSIETMMACGMGACLGCAVEGRTETERYFHACLDGPVFPAEVLKF